jgi:hypothetical protein
MVLMDRLFPQKRGGGELDASQEKEEGNQEEKSMLNRITATGF